MATSTTVTSIEVPTTATLVDVPRRAFAFLNAIGTQPGIYQLLCTAGYTEAEHGEGWRRLQKASGGQFLSAPLLAGRANDAIRELDDQDESLLHRAHAALVNRFSAQAEFVFSDLAPTQGPAAVLGVVTFLDRLDALEAGRDGTSDDDKKAIAFLATRGIDASERKRLRDLVALAQSAPPLPAPIPNMIQSNTEHEKALAELYVWYAEWVEIARVVVSRRADQIMLGIARRRSSSPTETDAASTADDKSTPDGAANVQQAKVTAA